MSYQHTPTRCMIKDSYLCLFQKNLTIVVSAVTSGWVCVHTPSFSACNSGKSMKALEFEYRDYSSSAY